MKIEAVIRLRTKLSDEKLCAVLDELYDQGKTNTREYALIEREIAHRDAVHEADMNKKKLIEKEKAEQLQALRDSFAQIEVTYSKGIISRAMKEEFGEEFIQDYEITDAFVVISHCKNPHNKNLNNVWECGSFDEAQKKLLQLLYYRVYDRYFREPSEESIVRLEAAIAELSK